MYAVIRAGGKQFKVTEGDVLEVERVKGESGVVEFVPLLVVDDEGVTRSQKSELAGARVVADVIGESKGATVDVVRFRSKTGYRRHTGHRQKYSRIQISGIEVGGGRSKKAATSSPGASRQGSGEE